MLKPLFARMARYNAWANRRLYAACAALDHADYHRERPAFFRSIHGTLNHLLLGDRLWRARIEGWPPPALPLDAELHPDLASLQAARIEEDAAILGMVEALSDEALLQPLSYRTTKGEPFTNQLATVLQHLFNHQTHHRGQVHDMLMATPVPPPPLDLIFFAREEEASQTPLA